MDKSELRKIYLDRRTALSADELAAKSRQIAECSFEHIDLRDIGILHTFIPIRKMSEIDTSFIYERIWAEFPAIKTAAPHADPKTGGLEHRLFTAATTLHENKWGILEPADGQIVGAGAIDLALVPLLCFDKLGNRVGYGKGFYDRFLTNCRANCLKVGLSVFPPVEEIKDADGHDVPLDRCITPEAIFSFDPNPPVSLLTDHGSQLIGPPAAEVGFLPQVS